MVKKDNPYIADALVSLVERENAFFVVAQIVCRHDYNTLEEPSFMRDKNLSTRVLRLAGFRRHRVREFVYHAEDRTQASMLVDVLERGGGYSVMGMHVEFKRVDGSAPTFGARAAALIQNYLLSRGERIPPGDLKRSRNGNFYRNDCECNLQS